MNIRIKILQIIISAALLVAPLSAMAQKNVAYQDKNVRISVVTEGCVRLEYSPTGRFVNDSSLIAVNRNYPKAQYKVKTAGTVVVSTPKLVLRYKKGTGKFTDKNLSICSSKENKSITPFLWKPGMKDDKNLKGTNLTLDRYNGNLFDDDPKQPMVLNDGLLSRNGWTLIDDSKSYLFDHSEWPWVTTRQDDGEAQDWYFMAYGHDYKQALKDYTVFAGRVPLPPRYAFGYWWSRYWTYTDNEMRELVDNFQRYGIPLDVLVMDMDWHYSEAGKGGWTGYSFNTRLFPDPAGFLHWVKSQDLEVTLNLHPAGGIAHYEDCYPAMARWMGIDPASKKDIPWESSNKRFMTGWFNTVLHPLEKAGVDFWWPDWQQDQYDEKFPHLSNVWWINYTLFSDMERNRNTRPLIYHRWGGLGNHRYQIGFSGDTWISWKSLDFQPYFNHTASNVLYGYWSHDIGGHGGYAHGNRLDPELYTRWMQFGSLSPILRTHCMKMTSLNKAPWMLGPKYNNIVADVINYRYKMAPYIYASARETYETGISLCRPMYYDYPEASEAYDSLYRNQYMFGDKMLVAPITAPMTDGVSEKQVWLPAGNDWYEVSTGTLLKGGQSVKRNFHIDEYPLYVKAGSIIPLYGKVKNLRSNSEPVNITVYPGDKGDFLMYEDNGNDKDYATQYATTTLSSVRNGNTLTVKIGARKGSYKDMPANRQFTVQVVASAVPQSVTVNGRNADFTYDGNNLTVCVAVPQTDCSVEKVVTLTFPQDALDVADGTIGHFRRIHQNMMEWKERNAGINFKDALGTMESTGLAIGYNPDQFVERIKAFRANYANLEQVLKDQGLDEEGIKKFLRATY